MRKYEPQKMPCQKLGRIDAWLGTERPTHSGTLPQESSNIRTHFCFTEPLGLEIEQGVVFEMLSVWQKKQLYIAAWQSRDRSKLACPTWTEDRSTCHPNPAKQSFFASKCPRAWAVIQFHFMLLRDVVDCGFYRSTCHSLTRAFRSCYFKLFRSHYPADASSR